MSRGCFLLETDKKQALKFIKVNKKNINTEA